MSHVLLLLSAAPGAARAGDCVLLGAGPLLGESRAGAGLAELTRAFLSPLGGGFSIWQLCLGQSPPWRRSLEETGAGSGGEWGMALGDTAVKACVEKGSGAQFFLW